MSAENFPASLAAVLQSEGGRVDDPQDPGGRTAYGVTQRVYDDWRRAHSEQPQDVWDIPPDETAAIYKALYWNLLKADELPSGVDFTTFDFGVNSGIGRAAKFLQRVVGVPDDGQIGSQTLAAVAGMDAADVINGLCDARLAFLQGLPTFVRFGHGWSTRVAQVRSTALGMAA